MNIDYILDEIIINHGLDVAEAFIEGGDAPENFANDLMDYYRTSDIEDVRDIFIEDYFDEDFGFYARNVYENGC